MAKKRKTIEKFLRYLDGRGFYIILFLCVAAIGISGYVLLSGRSPNEDIEDLSDYVLEFNDDLDSIVSDSFELEIPDETAVAPAQNLLPNDDAVPDAERKDDTQISDVMNPSEEAKEKIIEKAEAPTFFVRPVPGNVIKSFSGEDLVWNETMGDFRVHTGADLLSSEGSTVSAIADGVVSNVFYDDMLGYCVEIDHGGGLLSLSCGLMKNTSVRKGDTVKAGDVIGGVGDITLELSDAPHFHMEITKNGERIDPEEIIPPPA